MLQQLVMMGFLNEVKMVTRRFSIKIIILLFESKNEAETYEATVFSVNKVGLWVEFTITLHELCITHETGSEFGSFRQLS